MKKLLLGCMLLLGSINAKTQTYSFTFQGDATEEQLLKLKVEVLKIPQLQKCKINYKKEKLAGEIIYYVQLLPLVGETDPNTFSPVTLRDIIFENKLIALENSKIK